MRRSFRTTDLSIVSGFQRDVVGHVVQLGCHDKVVLVQTLDFLRLERHCHVAPAEADIRVMSLSFSEFSRFPHETECLGEVFELVCPLYAVRIIVYAPLGYLFTKCFDLLGCKWRNATTTGGASLCC